MVEMAEILKEGLEECSYHILIYMLVIGKIFFVFGCTTLFTSADSNRISLWSRVSPSEALLPLCVLQKERLTALPCG
jgi:hypothetical protein